tara:strand:- start:406 stop:693 length:288 start_codon:yes stop_codon:yes gene_type:complete
MRYTGLLIGLLLSFGTQAAVTLDQRSQPSATERLEPVVTVEFIDQVARRCSVNPNDLPEARGGDILYGILLAARESGLEVEAIEIDSCGANFSGF